MVVKSRILRKGDNDKKNHTKGKRKILTKTELTVILSDSNKKVTDANIIIEDVQQLKNDATTKYTTTMAELKHAKVNIKDLGDSLDNKNDNTVKLALAIANTQKKFKDGWETSNEYHTRLNWLQHDASSLLISCKLEVPIMMNRGAWNLAKEQMSSEHVESVIPGSVGSIKELTLVVKDPRFP